MSKDTAGNSGGVYVKFAPLPVFDQDRAIEFYTDALDCTVTNDQSYGEGGWRWVELAFAGGQTRLQFARRDDESAAQHPSLVLVTDDVTGVVERLRAKGVEIITEPTEASWQPGTAFAEFRDSEGNRIVVSSA